VGIPLFAPSLRLLASWVRDHAILWERVYGSPQRVVSNDEPGNPNTNDGLEYWLNHSDQAALLLPLILSASSPPPLRLLLPSPSLVSSLTLPPSTHPPCQYVFPHVTTFDSWEELLAKLDAADLPATRRAMRAHNAVQRRQQLAAWRRITRKAHVP
jgi:hypothetical protein